MWERRDADAEIEMKYLRKSENFILIFFFFKIRSSKKCFEMVWASEQTSEFQNNRSTTYAR